MVRAAGVVVYSGDGPRRYLLLRNRKRGEWGLPKGHLEKGEDDLQGALRELREETGIEDIELDEEFRHVIEYRAEGGKKRVTCFLGRAAGTEVDISREHDAYEWLLYADALKRLPHDNLRAALRAAETSLQPPASSL